MDKETGGMKTTGTGFELGRSLAIAELLLVWAGLTAAVNAAGLPADNPVAARYAKQPATVPAWIQSLPWNRGVNIRNFKGATDDERLQAAQKAVVAQGGGVVFFPAGTYSFADDIRLENGVLLRGEDPVDGNARAETYTLATRFEFPKYGYSADGEGTPITTAFKAIRVADPKTVNNCGVVNIAINRGHICFEEADDHNTGRNRLVFGCLLRNTAAADPKIPNKEYSQSPHQRFTHRHRAAIHVYAGENLFVANNRIPKSGDGNFVVKPYTLVRVTNGKGQDFTFKSGKPWKIETIADGVEFDYDNRPGVYANLFGIGVDGAGLPNGTPETHPHGFRQGTVIRDNYIYCSGRCAITFTGDGVICSYNTIRYPKSVVRPTTTGVVASDGSATNDNRAMTMRGHHYVAEGNDYEVYSNLAFDGRTKINDGEGIMHENHQNSAVRDSRIVGNTGNRYLCLWVMDIDGLLIQSNTVTAGGNAIHILSRNRPVNNLRILDNILTVGNIDVSTTNGTNIVIERNRFTGAGEGRILVDDPSWAGENPRFVVEKPKPRTTGK